MNISSALSGIDVGLQQGRRGGQKKVIARRRLNFLAAKFFF